MKLYNQILQKKNGIAVLLDPDKFENQDIDSLIDKANFASIDYFFIGGSTGTQEQTKKLVSLVKAKSSIPIILFPGSSEQISNEADGILLLNLISGRNPDFLIGHHINAAETLNNSSIEILSTSYVLIDGGNTSSVSYISQTSPIPRNQLSIIRKTVLAGEQIGHRICFLDAGSGATFPISKEIIETVRKTISNPLIVGGGIRSIEEIKIAFENGANLVVIGNQIEENIDFLLDIHSFQSQFNR